VDGQPPTGRESLGRSIGPGRRSYSRPLDSAASSSGWLADASNVRLLIVSKRHPAALPMRDRGALRFNALRRNAVGNRRQSTHSSPLSCGAACELARIALRVSAAPGLGTGSQKRPNRTMAGTWGRSA
jgi:hypothetical protein